MTTKRPLAHLAVDQRGDFDVGQRHEVEVGAVERVREAALVAGRRQGHVADDELPVGFEDGALDAPLALIPASSPLSLVAATDRIIAATEDGKTRRRFPSRGARIRTGDLGHPKAARYQAAPRPDPAKCRFCLRWPTSPVQGPALRPRQGRVARRGRRAALRRDRRRRAGAAARALSLQRGRDRPAETVRPRRPGEHDARGRPLRGGGEDDRRLARRGRAGRRRRAGDLGADPGLHGARRQQATAATGSSPGSGSRTTRPAPCARTSAPTPGRCWTGWS